MVTTNKSKNLVVLHLESLSHYIFNQEKKNLKGISDLMSRSVVFEHFFSSATSSLMAMTDFLYGNDDELENSISFDAFNKPVKKQENLFDLLGDRKYRVAGFGYPKIWRDDVNKYKLFSESGERFEYMDNYEDFISQVKEFMITESEEPFAVYIWDILSHLYYSDAEKDKGENFFERRSIGYSSIDRTVRHVVSILEQYGLMENTIIVGFGDHGDELWNHALNSGFCHAIEPYTSIIWTPAFIYQSEEISRVESNIVSLIDLKNTILGMLGEQDRLSNDFAGIDITKRENKYVYSRNLFVNQPDRENVENAPGLKKAFSITNDYYHLIHTGYGLEMYAYKVDPENHSNLLSFFDMDRGELKFNNRGATHVHFRKVMQPDQIEHIKKNYYELADALKKRLMMKNDSIIVEQKNPIDMSAFNRIRDRKYYW